MAPLFLDIKVYGSDGREKNEPSFHIIKISIKQSLKGLKITTL